MEGRRKPFRIIETAVAMLMVACVAVNCDATPSDTDTCQCGVFLLGSPPLKFSADAKPVLSGLPVSANCSATEDKVSCATICRQLIQAMSDSHENSHLVQTVVLAATRTLACQRFNESHKLPVPRVVDGGNQLTIARLDEGKKSWKFFVGPLARRDTEAEEQAGTDPDDDNPLANLSEPRWLGGFYRWCDSHWAYAGVSLQEPLCCYKNMPKKCPTSPKTAAAETEARKSDTEGANRKGRLIIKKRPEDDLSSEEEDLQIMDDKTDTENSSTETKDKVPPTISSLADTSSETEGPTGNSSSEVINIFGSEFEDEENPPKRKPLNSTVLAETFKFMGALMKSMGYGEVADGIAHVLPSSTAAQLLERVDVGGWVGTYQERYTSWPREFNLGYCYLEYSMYNIANEGIMATTTNLLSRFFKTNQGPMTSQQQQHLNYKMSNHITPMSSMGDAFHMEPSYMNSLNGIPGNRRVRRASRDPTVSVSRSYSSITGERSRARMDSNKPSKPSLEQLASIARVETAKPAINSPLPAPAPAIERRDMQPNPTASVKTANGSQPSNASSPRVHGSMSGQRPRTKPQNRHPPKPEAGAPAAKDNSAGTLINLASALVQTAMGGPEVDKVSLLMNSAIPALGQVATNPMVQNVVTNIVTSFLTPPRPGGPVNKPTNNGPTGTGPSGGTAPDSTGPSGPSRKPNKPIESNEIPEPTASSSNTRPNLSSPSGSGPSGSTGSGPSNPLAALLGGSGPSGGGGGGGGSNMISNLLSQIVQTYVKHYFSNMDSKPPPQRQPQRPQKVSTSSSSAPSTSTNEVGTKPDSETDIVQTILDFAKPVFLSYFGVVPGHPGFGQLSAHEHKVKEKIESDSIYLTRDPDPGMGITEILTGSTNIPETGNPVFDFGNRIAYAFSRANEPQQGLYCFKQYTVNKIWDYFKFGVRTVFN